MDQSGPRIRMPGVVYQSDDALRRYVDAGILTDETLASAFTAVVRRFPDRTALAELDWSCTYAELDILSDRAAAALLRLGLEPLNRVIFQMTNSKEMVISVIACFKAGLIPICTLAAHRHLEIGYIGNHAGARAHIVHSDDAKFDYVAFSRQLREHIPTLRHTIIARGDRHGEAGFHHLNDLIAQEDAVDARWRVRKIDLDPFQVALFQLSGGTTGVPKIIPRFHNEYLYTIRTVIDFHQLDHSTVAFTPNPMMHNAPMACVWAPALFSGGEVAISGSLDAATIGPLLAQRRPNWLMIPAPILLRLKESGWFERLDFTHVKGFSTASGAAKVRDILGGAPTWPLFGMTEGLLCYCNASDPDEARYGTVGRPLSDYDDIQIFAPDAEAPAPEGEIGELVIRGPCTIRGYYDAQERNETAFTRDGYYRSGDLMRIRQIDGRRYLIFEGRVKDVIDRGGEKINCEEVERVAIGHPAISAVAIIGMPDKSYGERICAFVILATDASPLSKADLCAFLEAQGLAKFKWPERIEVVREFPTTSSGKLSKPRLREIIAETLKSEERAQANT